MRKKDGILVGIILVVALICFGLVAISARGETADVVRVYLGGELQETLPFGVPTEFRLPQEDGSENVISVTETQVTMGFSTCKNQICVHGGAITRENAETRPGGAWIVCLPNRVSVEVGLKRG